ncbi:ribosomal protein small subunit S18 [Thermoplasma volcanium GSS1]|uniref:Small ribosomal subunit protein uS13 n=1 Tax=Thermoplasma volcanium (strain ATCC 51530 / DSM 4299 / JCM 9571 / NBRC 15438 / GSS1) TaxID=273116 RepID=RS13_THEVO|nr:30S ribosomal protein S13 [Thermoplasma volcanium]Q97B96.1 RecName: Full=Small ribosomal subunit protein uS13; AltName: Full=30S ribosomal protein S13 [Thermoplasma volcanium GSS1]BAB59703.1 ribosomal protein small subunit S18 [Thermoplasma volcanium GSS1]
MGKASANNVKSDKEAAKPAAKKDENKDFQYIVRIANKDLNGERPIPLALSDLKGIGLRLGYAIAERLNLQPTKKIGELKEDEIEKLKEYVENKEYDLPDWLLNHRREPVTGKNLNLVTTDLDVQVQEDINLMKKIRSYKGIRHEKGKKVRGQRTRSNGRRGLSIGVVRKKE